MASALSQRHGFASLEDVRKAHALMKSMKHFGFKKQGKSIEKNDRQR